MNCPTCKNPLTNSTTNCEWCDAPLSYKNNLENEDEYLNELIKKRHLLAAVKYYASKYNVSLKESKNKIDELVILLSK